jgi:hypothetical protein
MSKQLDSAVKHLTLEILENVTPEDVLKTAGIENNKVNVTMAKRAITRFRKQIIDSANADAIETDPSVTKFKNFYIKDVRSVTDVRKNGRVRVATDGSLTPINEWGHFELLSYFLELYYNRTGKEYPIETPGVVYRKFAKNKGKWEVKSTRGLNIMAFLLKKLNTAEAVKDYLDWWFAYSFTRGQSLNWGWLGSATMLSSYAVYMTNLQNKAANSTAVAISPLLPMDFIGYVQGLDNIFNYVSNLKTQKDLIYVYSAWKDKMDSLPDHPVVKMLKEAISRNLIGGRE